MQNIKPSKKVRTRSGNQVEYFDYTYKKDMQTYKFKYVRHTENHWKHTGINEYSSCSSTPFPLLSQITFVLTLRTSLVSLYLFFSLSPLWCALCDLFSIIVALLSSVHSLFFSLLSFSLVSLSSLLSLNVSLLASSLKVLRRVLRTTSGLVLQPDASKF